MFFCNATNDLIQIEVLHLRPESKQEIQISQINYLLNRLLNIYSH